MGAVASSLASSLAALASLQVLGLQFGYGHLAAQLAPIESAADVLAAGGLVYRQVVAAASQLPLLEELHMPGANLPLDSTEPAWA
jgi:hypothetical protein